MSKPSVFAILPSGRLNWVVASIHGEAERLHHLHGRLAERLSPKDNLIYLGNLVGRSQHVAATANELLLFRRALMAEQLEEDSGAIAYLRGSQEEMWHKLLQIHFAPNPREVLEWMLAQGIGPTVEAYGGNVDEGRRAATWGSVALSQWTNRLRANMRYNDGHDPLLSTLKRAAFTEDGSLLFVNSGIDPSRPLSEQRDSFWWGGRDFENLDAPYAGFKRVVRGFDIRHRGLVVRDSIASVDGGCGFGGPLLAACFSADGELIESLEA